MKISKRFGVALAGAALFASPSLFAGDATWVPNTAGNWADDVNWNPATAPGATSGTTNTDTATFLSTTITSDRTVTADSNRNIQNITVDATGDTGTARTYVLSGGPLLLTAGGITQIAGVRDSTSNSTRSGLSISANMVLQGDYTFTNNTSNGGAGTGMTEMYLGSASTTSGADGLGNLTITFSGQTVANTNTGFGTQIAGTAGGTVNGIIADGTGNTVSIVKEGAGAWRFNNNANSFTGGIAVNEGTIIASGDTAFSSGGITLGETGSANNATILGGSGRNIANTVTVNNGSGLRTMGANNGASNMTFAGAITLNDGADLRFQKSSSRSVIVSGGVTGTGNVEVYNNASSGAGEGVVFSTLAINNVGTVTNASPGTGTLTQTSGGIIGSNVTEFIQDSATSTTILSLANSYGTTSVLAGTLETTGIGTLGTGDVTVNGGSLLLGSSISLSDTATLNFVASVTPTIFLNNDISDIVGGIYNMTTDTSIGAGIWGASDLNTFFGTNVFDGLGTLTVVPEPSTYALAMVGLLGVLVIARRRKQTLS